MDDQYGDQEEVNI